MKEQKEQEKKVAAVLLKEGGQPQVTPLTPIHPVYTSKAQLPGFLTHEQVNALGVLHVTAVVHPYEFDEYLQKVQAACQSLVAYGQNPNLIGFEDLNIAFVTTLKDPSGQPVGALDVLMIAQSKTLPEKWTEVKTKPVKGEVSDKRFYENVARDLVNDCPVKV